MCPSTPFWPITLEAPPTKRCQSTTFQNSLPKLHGRASFASRLPAPQVADTTCHDYRKQTSFSTLRIGWQGFKACICNRNHFFLTGSPSFPPPCTLIASSGAKWTCWIPELWFKPNTVLDLFRELERDKRVRDSTQKENKILQLAQAAVE